MPDLAGTKVLYLGYAGVIDAAGVGKIAQALNTAVNEQFDSAYLCFSSLGGYVGDGIFLFNHIKGLSLPVTIHNTGTVASIATTIFTAAQTRYCSPNSIFMIHPVAASLQGNMASTSLKSFLDSATKEEARTEEILRARTKIPEEILADRRLTEIYITPDKALEFELVGEVRDFALPPGNKIFHI